MRFVFRQLRQCLDHCLIVFVFRRLRQLNSELHLQCLNLRLFQLRQVRLC
jgi:hypothetical protein